AQTLGQVFTHEMKPMEVEILVAEMGYEGHPDQLFHILYDGTVVDEENFTVLGGEAETIAERLKDNYTEGMDLGAALRGAVAALAGPERTLTANDLEVAHPARSPGLARSTSDRRAPGTRLRMPNSVLRSSVTDASMLLTWLTVWAMGPSRLSIWCSI